MFCVRQSARALRPTSFVATAAPRCSAQRSWSHTARTMAQQYKLKDLASLDLHDGEMREVPVEGVEGVNVLLSKVNGKVHATSSKCTHYGAPLSKGVLTPHGRVTCPWHGACFQVTTGDVEDAPALDPISTFALAERDGGVYISSDEATLKSNRKNLKLSCKASGKDHVVVVGGGAGAAAFVEALRGAGFKGPVTLVGKEGVQPYDRTKLSKALLADISKVAWRTPDFYKEADIDLVHDEATSVDFSQKSVVTKSGKSINYTKLVLATGGAPKSLPLPGLRAGELQNVFLLRTLQDTQAINTALGVGETKKQVVVIGSSFIGLEVGNAMAGQGHDVTVVGMESAPVEAVFGAQVGNAFRAVLEKNGLKFKMSASVEKATPSSSDNGKVGAVHLKDGSILPAEIVIEGVGVGPATQFLKQSTGAPELLKDGSLKVNNRFQVEGADDVYAIGDIATYPYAGKHVRIEHWDVAQNAGRTAAKSIVHPNVAVKPFIPVFWSALGAQLRYCGHPTEGYDDIVIDGSLDTSNGPPSFAAYYTKGDTVVAVATMQKDPVMVKSAELMRNSRMLTKRQLQAKENVLHVAF